MGGIRCYDVKHHFLATESADSFSPIHTRKIIYLLDAYHDDSKMNCIWTQLSSAAVVAPHETSVDRKHSLRTFNYDIAHGGEHFILRMHVNRLIEHTLQL